MQLTEWRLFDGDIPHVSTFAFHEHRDRAPHLEQSMHRDHLLRTAEAVRALNPASVVDLGCGDGGLLSLITDVPSWGYDWHPASARGWRERGIVAEQADVFNTRQVPHWGQVAVLTEVLEHLADPHGVVEWVSRHVEYVVASSPKDETADSHGDCHAWAWDMDGYEVLFEPHFEVLTHEPMGWSQIIVGRSRNR